MGTEFYLGTSEEIGPGFFVSTAQRKVVLRRF